MSNGLFNDVKYLEKGLDAAWTRHQVIANNIANADTPNFKSSKIEFETVFKSALEGDGFVAKRTRDKHITFGSGDLSDFSAIVTKNDNTIMRSDGNNVDIDYENAELAKNTIYYNTLVEKMTSEFSRLKLAITEGK